MKVFQILNGICYHYHPEYTSAAQARQYFVPEFLFVDAPDYVFEGWGYLDGKFVKPIPPDGWIYDDATGTFYPEEVPPDPNKPTYDELLAMYKAVEKGMTE